MADRADAAALAELKRRNVPPLGSALVALQELAAEVCQWQGILRERVAELESLTHRTEAGSEHVRAVVSAYERAMGRTADVLGTLAGLNIDERVRQLDQRTGAALAEGIERIVARLGYPGARRDPRIRQVVYEELAPLLGEAAA
jgi:hypothetical protein